MTLHPHLDDLLELRHQARALGLESNHLVNSALSGLYASVFRGHGLDFEEVREYREGDDIRNMEWNITARTGIPHLKVFREERERSVILCVDQGPHMSFGTRGTFKSIQAARACALLGWAASTQHERIGALLYGHPRESLRYLQPSRGRRTLWRTLRALTEPPASGPSRDSALIDAVARMARGTATGSLIFVIGALHEDPAALEAGLGGLLQRHTVVLLPVDDPADRSIPAMGRVVFSAADGRLMELDTDDEAGRVAFRERWDRQRQALETMARRLGAWMMPLRTDQDVHVSLMYGMRRRAMARVYR